MTGLIVLALVPLLAAAMFAIRAIAERKARVAAERAVQSMKERTHQQDEERLRFLGIVAHELRSPLSAIMGYQELLADGVYGSLDPKAHEPIDRIARAARQLLTLTDGMEELAGAKDASNGDTLPTDITSVIHESLANAEREATGRGLVLHVARPEVMPPLRANAERAAHVFDLTLYAAIKAAQPGILRINVALADSTLTLGIQAPGIERQALLPAPRNGDAMPPITSGAGLRLAIARRLAESIGGSLTVEADSLFVKIPVRQ